MQDFIGWMKDEHPDVMESSLMRALASVLAGTGGGALGGLAGGLLGGPAGAAAGGLGGWVGGKELAAEYLPNEKGSIFRVSGIKDMKKSMKKRQRKK